MLAWVTMTPLGSPLEPEVHMIAARSRPGSTSAGGGGGAAGRWGDSTSRPTPSFSAIGCSFGSSRAETTMRLAWVAATMRSSAVSPSATGSGTATSPARMAPR